MLNHDDLLHVVLLYPVSGVWEVPTSLPRGDDCLGVVACGEVVVMTGTHGCIAAVM
jgi:hypothetical protein